MAKKKPGDEMRDEYDFKAWGPMVRGKYHARATAGGRMICIAPDLVRYFPDEAVVNETLRKLVEFSRRNVATARRGRGGAKKAA